MLRIGLALALACLTWALPKAQSETDLTHTVDSGETLIGIAAAYGLTLAELLELNALDPEAILRIGQEIVIPASAVEPTPTPAPKPSAERTPPPVAIVKLGRADMPSAPVYPADAPMLNPADASAQVCVMVFRDDNHNAMREPNEPRLAGAEVVLVDSAGQAIAQFDGDGGCARDLPQARYRIESRAPAGFGWTSPAQPRVDLSAGGDALLAFGAKRDLAPFVPPPPHAQPEHPPDAPDRSLLRELGGLFALALAGAVLACGFVVSVFLRGR